MPPSHGEYFRVSGVIVQEGDTTTQSSYDTAARSRRCGRSQAMEAEGILAHFVTWTVDLNELELADAVCRCCLGHWDRKPCSGSSWDCGYRQPICGTVLFKSPFIGSQMNYQQNRNRLADTAESRFVVAKVVKKPPAMQETEETWVWSLGREDHLEKERATHSSSFAWEIPWRKEPGWLQSMDTHRSNY